uniref:O-antigen ligase n=1 Tax=uncultured Thiotrichaceae bacterium TaxID=298394 RepID=A0A6S6U0X5_9GAMM|nr:MAG: O-antigen ligase [uncultured Thiotrichaceae bacterium]
MHNKWTNLLIMLGCILLLSAPFPYSGKNATAALTAEIIGTIVLFIIAHTQIHRGKLSKPVRYFIAYGLILTIIYLIPLPTSIWEQLPGRTAYVDLSTWLEKNYDIFVYKSLSVNYLHTLSFALGIIPALALFLTTLSIPVSSLRILVYAFLLSAAGQAVLAILQYYTQNPSLFSGIQSMAARGSYLNQNHLTAYMEIAEPIALAFVLYYVIRQTDTRAVQKTLKIAIFSLLSMTLLFIPLISTSRMGLFLLLLSIILSFWTMTPSTIRSKIILPLISLRLLLLGVFITLHYTFVTNTATTVMRAAPQNIAGDLRWTMWKNTWEGILALAPFGSGPGTFQQGFRPFQSIENNLFINHAHNDYLEFMFETGVLGVVLILYFAYLYGWQWRQIKLIHEKSLMRLLQSGAGVGIFLFMVYSLTEFNFHTPANVMYFCFLLGIFFRQPDTNNQLNSPPAKADGFS